MKMKQLSLDDFTAKTASDSPSPGGGSIAALTGSLAASLASMVAALTVNKSGYEEYRAEMTDMLEKCEQLRSRLLDDIDRDCVSFDGYIEALALPKDTDEQKTARREAMQQALKHAAEVPLSIAQTSLEVMPLAKAAVMRGNKNAITDGVIAAMMSRTAVLAALCNVKINLGMIKDKDYTDKMWSVVNRLEQSAIDGEKEILSLAKF